MPKIIISPNPAQEAGQHITKLIEDHKGDFVCLLSGGSALDIVEYITPQKKCFHETCKDFSQCQQSECRTIFMMGDERVSGEPKINNSLQLLERFADSYVAERFVATVPEAGESATGFALRIEKLFFEKIVDLQNVKILHILGIGTDGHTAGIFPLPEETFRRMYQDDLTYVPVELEGLTIDSRASFTPYWILHNVDVAIGYAAGASKQEIMQELYNQDKKLNERPAELLKRIKNASVYTDQDISPAPEDIAAGL